MPRLLAALALTLLAAAARAQDANEAAEKAIQAATAAVAPSVVKIETSGGRAVASAPAAGPGGAPAMRKGVGPTTGLVVGADGYVISSAFNFANKPTDIFVTVPGRPRLVAKIVASDPTRMLTLLKVDAKDLPVPAAFPKAELRVGQWAVALGRALDPDIADSPSVSVGIVSSLGRIFGKMIQCDAKVSPVNYGGPLVAVDGRVLGVLVPASPRGETETAGVEWYDSGIGFAVPLDDVLAVLPKLKQGKDLKRGLLGITAKVQEEVYNLPAVLGPISRESAAAQAGLKPGDTVVAIDGKPVRNFSQVQHLLGPKYEGDTLSITVTRDGKPIEFKNVVLTGAIASFAQPFFGILPVRDDPDPGVAVRYVYPKSPAALAGLKVGDRLMTLGAAGAEGGEAGPIASREALLTALGRLTAGTEVTLDVKRKEGGKVEPVKLKLAALPDTLPEALPLPSSAKRALEAAKKAAPKAEGDKAEAKEGDAKKDGPETGLIRRKNATLGREFWVYVPPNYDKNVSHGVILWLHRARAGGRDADDLTRIFGEFCADHHFLMVGPKSKNAEGWVPSETEEILPEVRAILGEYTVDKSRVVAHGMGNGGQMAFYLGFNARDLIRGVATTGAALTSQPKEPVPGQPLAFFLVGGEQDPLMPEIAESVPKLTDKKYTVLYRPLKEFGKEYLLDTTLEELKLWLDSLDRI